MLRSIWVLLNNTTVTRRVVGVFIYAFSMRRQCHALVADTMAGILTYRSTAPFGLIDHRSVTHFDRCKLQSALADDGAIYLEGPQTQLYQQFVPASCWQNASVHSYLRIMPQRGSPAEVSHSSTSSTNTGPSASASVAAAQYTQLPCRDGWIVSSEAVQVREKLVAWNNGSLG
jgi:hypothetical protein